MDIIKKFIKINKDDNVAVALDDFKKGDEIEVDGKKITILDDVGRGHKISLCQIVSGENIIKYGFPIGFAVENIEEGKCIHTHNVKTNLDGPLEYKFNQKLNDIKREDRKLTFQGYRREDGSVGIRNELWIVPTVGCVNGVADAIIRRFKEEVNPQDIDAIEAYKHNYGCGQLGDDLKNTRIILQDIVKHPNAGGVLVLGLGCENNYMTPFKETLGKYNEERVRFLVTQEVGDEVEEALKLLKELYMKMKEDRRVSIPISELRIGLKCGGSDGFSGITANPLLGEFSDFLVSQGGTTVLTEVPEMFGAETILMERAKNEEVFEKTVKLINDFKEYFISHNQPVYENPSPGNKAGGLTTLEDKSLGCTQKGGKATVVDVLNYGEIIKEKGFNLLSAPGYDLVAATAQGAAGCHMVLFTTGRGTPFGTFVPTMKISTNTRLYELKPHWIDFNAGALLDSKEMDEVLESFIEYTIKVASGEKVNSEKNYPKEMAVFKTGVTV